MLIAQPVPANLQIQNAMTYSAWIYTSTYTQGDGNFAAIAGSWNNSQAAGAGLFIYGQNAESNGTLPGAVAFAIYQTGGSYYQVQTTTQVPLNQWTLLTVSVVANQAANIYLNGVLQPSFSNGSSSLWNGTVKYSGAGFEIGQQVDLNRAFNGLIDEVQIYSSALSGSQVQGIYNAGSAGICTAGTSETNGVCGSSNGGCFATPPTANLCTVGTATYITDPGSWNWNCNGNLGGSSASCSATNIGPLCAALPSGLIDWWPADDNTNDIVGGNSGVINGTVGYAAGETGQAFSFSGAGGVSVTMPSLLTTNGQVTVSFWMKWNGTDGQIPFNFNPYYDLWFMNGAFGFNTGNDEVWGIGSSGMANRWIQVTAVFTNGDPNNNQLYLNGVQQTLTQRFGTTPTSAQVSTTATIGNQNNRVYYFNGLIDSVQVYNGALTQAEIQSIYDAGAAGVCTAEIRTTTTVSSSENPANTGDTVTLTATVVPNFATGTVTFMDGSTSLGTGTISGGQAQYSTSTLAIGSHSITAVYSGDATYAGSTSTPLSQAITADGQSCIPQPSGLIDWWPGNGNTSDIVAGNNATVVGTVGYTTGEVGQAFSVDGTAGHLTAPVPSINVASGTQATVAFWMYWENNSTESMPIAFGNSTFFYDLLFWQGAFGFNTGYNDILGISSSGLANKWVQVTAVFTNGDPHSNELYINGVQQTLAQEVGTTPNSNQLLENAYIGGVPNFYYFYGDIDEVKIYNGALTAAQIQSIYNAGNAGVCQ